MNWALLIQSLWLSAAVTLISGVVGIASALWLATAGRLARILLLVAGISILALPPFIPTNAWLDVASFTGDREWLPFSVFSTTAAVFVMSAMYWPIPMLVSWAAWTRLDPGLIESDPVVRGWPLLWHVMLPIAGGVLAVGLVVTFVLALNNFSVASTLQARTYPVEVWIRYNTGLSWREALLASWPLAAAPIVLLACISRKRVRWPHLRGGLDPKMLRSQLGSGWVFFGGSIALLGCVVSLFFPLAELALSHGTWAALPRAFEASQGPAWNSVKYALPASILCCFAGLLLAASGRAQRLIQALWLIFFLPGTIIGIGFALMFDHAWLLSFRNSAAAVVLVLAVRHLALAWGAAKPAFDSSDRALADVARLEGASFVERLRHVYWPQGGKQILAAGYFVFLLALWEVECLLPVVPPGGDTIAMRVFNLLHYGHTPEVNALCLVLLAMAVLPLIVWTLARLFRSAVPVIFTGGFIVFWTSGCSPTEPAGNTPLQSGIFSSVEVLGNKGAGLGQFTKPRSVAVDAEDNLYVADMTGRVQKFSSSGAFLLSWQMPQTELGRPKGMCRDHLGNIVVIEPHYARINHFDPTGKLVMQWGRHGTNSGELAFPRAAAADSKGFIYVSEYGLFERIQRFEIRQKDARLLASFGSPGFGPGQFNRPEGVGLDPGGNVYVADSCNHRIQVLDPEGRFLTVFGKAGRNRGELSYPYDVAVDKNGLRFVCEFGNSRIQVFDTNNAPLEIVGGPGALPGQFNNPWSIALDSAGNLYVADSQNHRVQKLVRMK